VNRSLTAIVLSTPATSRPTDVAFALQQAGAEPRLVSLHDLMRSPDQILDARIVVVARGFGSTDLPWTGRVQAHEFAQKVGDHLRRFVTSGRPILGIGEGFELLTQTGILPGSLAHHDDGGFHGGWVQLEVPATRCIWTQGLGLIDCPIAHHRGRYVHPSPEDLANNGQVALRYRGSTPDGSIANIAGVCDPSGLVLGLMPHPERHVVPRQHPQHRMPHHVEGSHLGLTIFERGVHHVTRKGL
jgi:phosphoribosylformylglycinamidine synthase